MTARINLLIALPAEAKPLRQHFGLQREQAASGRPVYSNGPMRLLISGCGAEAARDGARQLAATSDMDTLWINIGIAGHPRHPIGDIFLAREIHHLDTGERWQVQLPDEPPCPTDTLFTLPAAEKGYRHDGLCDMEGAAFYAEAIRYAKPRQVQCLKVVSDNPRQPSNLINGKMVNRLMAGQIRVLERLIRQLETTC